jgi:hypothetical protein
MDAKTRTARRLAEGFTFKADTRTREEKIAQYQKNIATVEARGPRSAGLAAMLRRELAELEAGK